MVKLCTDKKGQNVLPPVSYDREVNLLNAMIDPLKLLIRPSVLWGVFTYAIILSPQGQNGIIVS
jgi:hypothetical protein